MTRLISTFSRTIALLIFTSCPQLGNSDTVLIFTAQNAHLVDTRLDPIVTPGKCNSHVHSVFGAATFGKTVRAKHLKQSVCTTSNVIPNKSMYWAPSMYIWNPNNNMYYIVPSFSRVYYRYRAKDVKDVKPIPLNLRVVIGNASRMTEWKRDDEHDDIRWTIGVENRASTSSKFNGDWGYLRKNKITPGTLELNVRFPDCLKVKNGKPVLDSSDHRSHAIYSGPGHRQFCPKDFPYHMPLVNMEVRYDLTEMRGLLGSKIVNNLNNWRLSTGDETGASAHADFLSGWPEDMLEDTIKFCRNGKGKNCPITQYSEFKRGEMRKKRCDLQRPIPDEEVSVIPELVIFPDNKCPPGSIKPKKNKKK